MVKFLQYIARWEWGQKLLLALFGITSSVFFNHTLIWPSSGKYVRIIILATDEFSLKSCIRDLQSELENTETIQ